MGVKRRRFNAEYRAGAARVVRETEKPMTQVARDRRRAPDRRAVPGTARAFGLGDADEVRLRTGSSPEMDCVALTDGGDRGEGIINQIPGCASLPEQIEWFSSRGPGTRSPA